jgi:hypothetical protein
VQEVAGGLGLRPALAETEPLGSPPPRVVGVAVAVDEPKGSPHAPVAFHGTDEGPSLGVEALAVVRHRTHHADDPPGGGPKPPAQVHVVAVQEEPLGVEAAHLLERRAPHEQRRARAPRRGAVHGIDRLRKLEGHLARLRGPRSQVGEGSRQRRERTRGQQHVGVDKEDGLAFLAGTFDERVVGAPVAEVRPEAPVGNRRHA